MNSTHKNELKIKKVKKKIVLDFLRIDTKI